MSAKQSTGLQDAWWAALALLQMRSWVGLSPTRPHSAAGILTLPPPSVPAPAAAAGRVAAAKDQTPSWLAQQSRTEQHNDDRRRRQQDSPAAGRVGTLSAKRQLVSTYCQWGQPGGYHGHAPAAAATGIVSCGMRVAGSASGRVETCSSRQRGCSVEAPLCSNEPGQSEAASRMAGLFTSAEKASCCPIVEQKGPTCLSSCPYLPVAPKPSSCSVSLPISTAPASSRPCTDGPLEVGVRLKGI